MRIVVFDIDGTLARTGEADGPCFGEAYRAVFQQDPVSVSWDDYAHVTDWGILDESLGTARGRSSSLAERTTFERAYRAAWERCFAKTPAACTEVPGAAALIKEITANSAFACGVATGGTRAAATFKLESVGIDPAHLPGAYANDAITRSAIMRSAARVLGASPSEIVYVGDGRWDVVTCRELGIRFIGVAAESPPDALHAAGAHTVIPDFVDRDAFWRAVDQAAPPSSPPD